MHLDDLLRVCDVEPASIRLPSLGDDLNQNSPRRCIRNVRDTFAARLYIHFQLLVLLQRVLFDEFHVHTGVLNGNTFLAAGYFNGDSRLQIARGRRSPRFGRRCRLILGRHTLDNHRTGSDANASEKLSGKSHRLPNSIVHGTASRVKSRRVKRWMRLTLEMLLRRCSAVETLCNGHLTHLFGSCNFSRTARRATWGSPENEIYLERFIAGRQTDSITISTDSARRAKWVLPPTPFMSGRSPIPPPGPSSPPSIRPPRTSTKSWAKIK